MYGQIDILYPCRSWIVEHDDVDLVSANRELATERVDRSRNAANARIERVN